MMDANTNQQPHQPEPDEVESPKPRVLLMRGIGGGRKTEQVIKGFGELQQEQSANGKQPRQDVLFTPRHNLNDEVAERWIRDTGLTAMTIEGRTAKDPRNVPPEKADREWCEFPERVDAATDVGMPVQQTCCSYENKKKNITIECAALTRCGFQGQFDKARNVDMVAMPHQLLAHEQKKLDRPGNVGIDEDFLENLISELPRPKSDFRFEVEELLLIDELIKLHEDLHVSLYDRLKMQIDAGEIGGIQKKYWTQPDQHGLAFTAELFGKIKYVVGKLVPDITELRPDIDGRKLERFKKLNAGIWARRRELLFVDKLAEILREMMERSDIEVSGRAYLYQDEKKLHTYIGLRWLNPIVQQWRANNIVVMSATMPPVEIVSHAFPGCDIIPDDTDYDVTMPKATRFTQVKNAPVSLTRTGKPANQVALRRYAMERALELKIGKPADKNALPSILIGVQKSLEEAWQAKPLPEHYSIEHFGNVSGLNNYREVQLLVSMGTTLVKPIDIEDQIAAITGRDPQRLTQGWFLRARGTIVLKDGSHVHTQCHVHPDELAEKWRKHKHCGPRDQLILRGRPYTRSAVYPLYNYVLSNEPMYGIKPDVVLDWVKDQLEPMAMVEPMEIDGFLVLAPKAMRQLWPDVFTSTSMTDRELKALREASSKPAKRILNILAGWRKFKVQKAGPRQKWREGYFNPARFDGVENLRGALETAFGAGLQLIEEG